MVLNLLTVLLLLGAVAGVAALAALWPRCTGNECPSVAALRSYSPPQASRVFDRNGELIAHLAPERRIVVPLEQIPAHVSGAFLAVEDKRFFRHGGVDYRRVVGAMLRNARAQRYQEGFSTITMQLARNLFPDHLTREKTLRRKLQEIVLAREIEQSFSKAEILEMYLNQIYLGEGLYGVEAAAQGYFGKPARELVPHQAALLAALPRAPNYYSPRRNPVAVVRRRNLVLGLMAESGVLSGLEAERGREAALGLAPPPEATGEAPYYVAAVRRELRERFGPEAETDGLRVYTLLDPALQRSAERALRQQIEAIEAGKFGRFRGAACNGRKVEKPESCLQGLFVAMDAHTGDVRALVGGRDFALSQFDRVMQARRQAGSAFKPIVYATALAAGIPITTPLVGPGAGDYESGYRPADHVSDSVSIDLREGLRASSNRAAVALGERVGVGRVVQTAHALGLSTPIQEYPSTFLGAADVIPLELIAAYSVFSNNGVLVTPRLIKRVENAQGQVIWDAPIRTRPVLPPGVAFLTLNLMQDVVNRGTGIGVRTAGLPYTVPAAGKTGTTNDAADVWFIGTTPDLVAGVWIGFDKRQRITNGASGGGLAAPVWGRVVADFYKTATVPAAWTPPGDLIAVEIDRESGRLPTANCPQEHLRTEWFIPGTEPAEYCPLHPEAPLDRWFRRTFRGVGDWLRGRSGDSRDPSPPLNTRRPLLKN
ncbi:PBP1A family penicillin-binding protein [soil metagenome]